MAKTDWTLTDQVQPSDMNAIGEEINQNAADIASQKTYVDEHLADVTVQGVRYAADTGTDNAKVVTLPAPVPTAYFEGMAIAFKNKVLNTGAVTINVNGLGAKSILKSNGSALAGGNLRLDSIYTIRYNGTAFILQGEGGDVEEFFGDGSDGVLDTTGNLTFPVIPHSGLVIKQYTSIKINAGHIVTTSDPCRGLILFSKGDINVTGIIDMSKKAGFNDVNLPALLIGATPEEIRMINEELRSIRGGSGGKGYGGGSAGNGRILLGGYGSGGSGQSGSHLNGGSGGGIENDIFGKGVPGAGGQWINGSFTYTIPAGAGIHGGGGGGGVSYTSSSNGYGGRGGAGNGGGGGGGGAGRADYSTPVTGSNGRDGEPAGGFILLIAKGAITVNGTLTCNGGNGGDGGSGYNGSGNGGGGSGGGVVALLYKGGFNNNGTITVSGGSGGSGGNPGQSGSIGTVYTRNIS
jgi:hypothetical protein